MSLPRLHTMNEVIDALGVSRQTIRTLVDSGELPAIKVGAQWRFHADAVNTLLASRTVAPLRPVKGAA